MPLGVYPLGGLALRRRTLGLGSGFGSGGMGRLHQLIPRAVFTARPCEQSSQAGLVGAALWQIQYKANHRLHRHRVRRSVGPEATAGNVSKGEGVGPEATAGGAAPTGISARHAGSAAA
jgi:hypothetical protein